MHSQVNSRWKIGAIVLGLIAPARAVHTFQVNSRLGNVFHYDVGVTVRDKETGIISEGVTTHGPSS